MVKKLLNYKIAAFLTVLLFIIPISFYGQVTIASQSFDGLVSDDLNYSVSNASRVATVASSGVSGSTALRFRRDSGSDVDSEVTFDNVSLTGYTNVTVSISFKGVNVDDNEDLDFYVSYNNGSSYTNIGRLIDGNNSNESRDWGDVDNSSGTATTNPYVFSVPSGNAQIRIQIQAENLDDSEFFYIDNVMIEGDEAPEINIQGNGIDITNGDTTPSFIDFTNLGTTDETVSIVRTFTIQNIGTAALNFTNNPVVSITGAAMFSITSNPTVGAIAAGGSDVTFQVTFNPATAGLGSKSATITIESDDPYNPFTFDIEARVAKSFFDSDGDGIFDDKDIDDDNDGLIDANEELSCRNSPSASQVNYKFLNENFGAGTGRGTQLSSLYVAETTYCIEDGTSGTNTTDCPNLSNTSLNDGEYTIASLITTGVNGETVGPTGAIASWAWNRWANIEDHTPGDTNGRMAIFNADYTPGIFYETEIVGTLTGVPITYSFYAINLDKKDSAFGASEKDATGHRILPNITVNFLRPDRTLIASFNTGDITRCAGDTFVAADHIGPGPHAADATYNQCETSDWKHYTQDITLTTETTFIVQFINNAVGGLGNDIAIDDIVISQTLCDMDSDGVADVFDLDSDNDGIPDVVEGGLGHLSGGTAKLILSGDGNSNGMNDALEANIAGDSDGDGVPNYLDLDSDNDGIFDVDESGAGNAANLTYQNGDGDINGDGVGDGVDGMDNVRESDQESDNIIEYYGDGILDIYDFFEGVTVPSAYGNSNQGLPTGTGWYNYTLDDDGDGIPNYLDIMSNGTSFDILATFYSGLDANNDGIIDGLGTLYGSLIDDADGDGILDAFDTSDPDGVADVFDGNSSTFGSPRDLDRKLLLYFDGRNDYVEDVAIISGAATLMCWIKIDAIPTGVQRILGQNNFYLQIDAAQNVSVVGPSTLTYSSPIVLNQWVHIAATSSASAFKLYINGVEVATAAGASLAADASFLTIGRRSNTDSNYYKGYIDEVRVFDKALTENELQKMVYQELENNGGTINGSVVKLPVTNYHYNIATGIETVTNLPWANMQRYFRMDTYKDDIVDNLTTATIDVGSGAKMYNIKIIDVQSAPLPFVTQMANTDFASALTTSNGVNGNDAITSPASIVKIEHNGVYSNESQQHVALFVSSGNELSIKNNSELNISRYLYLNGAIDLEEESQLVQGGESILDSNSGGIIERDQQGTANSYNYNYWASSVGAKTTGGLPTFTAATNGNYVIKNNLLDGSVADNGTYPLPISFNASHTWADNSYSGAKRISTYWLYKFYGNDDDYNAWQKINENTNLLPGEGYTMKGTSGNIAISTNQNYVFKGKPTNGNVSLQLTKLTPSASNPTGDVDRLIGNPYASALDADEFIKDHIKETVNGKVGRNANNIFNGALYFWDHFGFVGSHNLGDYVGGYATYTLMGGTVAISNDERINNNNASGAKVPTQYIPAGQGFFVITALDYQEDDITLEDGTLPTVDGGTITFKNSQRIFKKEATGDAVFMKAEKSKETAASKSEEAKDLRPKIRLMFDSPKGYHRQLLIGADENTTNNFDLGFDGLLADVGIEDMYWVVQGAKLAIQGVPNFNEDQEFKLALKVAQTGLARIKIDALENLDNSTAIYIKDALMGTTKQINNQPFEIALDAGTYVDRFSLVFAPLNTLNVEEEILESGLLVFINNSTNEIQIKNTIAAEMLSVKLFNSLGQLQQVWNQNLQNPNLTFPVNNQATGMYLIQINTSTGTISKKVIVE